MNFECDNSTCLYPSLRRLVGAYDWRNKGGAIWRRAYWCSDCYSDIKDNPVNANYEYMTMAYICNEQGWCDGLCNKQEELLNAFMIPYTLCETARERLETVHGQVFYPLVPVVTHTGVNCRKCNDFCEYAEPSHMDGYTCWKCRNRGKNGP